LSTEGYLDTVPDSFPLTVAIDLRSNGTLRRPERAFKRFSVDLHIIRKVELGFEQDQGVTELIADLFKARSKASTELKEGGFEAEVASGFYQIQDCFSLGQIEFPI
jgi:hypothetical protein